MDIGAPPFLPEAAVADFAHLTRTPGCSVPGFLATRRRTWSLHGEVVKAALRRRKRQVTTTPPAFTEQPMGAWQGLL